MGTIKRLALVLGICSVMGASTAQAAHFTGTLYFTNAFFALNVYSVTYDYDDVAATLTMGSPVGIATLAGADGLMLNPDGTHLIVSGQTSGFVYNVKISDGTFTSVQPGTTGQDQKSYHMTLDPSHTKFYTSDFYTSGSGPLDSVPLPFGTQGTSHAVTGAQNSVTQIAFAVANSNVFYTASPITGAGNIGTINLGTGVTTQIFSSVNGAHSIIYDPFTSLMTTFGLTDVATFTQTGTTLKTHTILTGSEQFDQGSVDGFGHAFVAGNNEITFLDYSVSHDITAPDHTIFAHATEFIGIDDVAPLVDIAATKCPLSQGYWKNHASAWPAGCLPMSLGTHSYSETQLLNILNRPNGGRSSDASLILAKQLIAAKLNICNGSDGSSVAATIADADTLIGSSVIPAHIKSSSALGQQMTADGSLLDAFNNQLNTPNCTP